MQHVLHSRPWVHSAYRAASVVSHTYAMCGVMLVSVFFFRDLFLPAVSVQWVCKIAAAWIRYWALRQVARERGGADSDTNRRLVLSIRECAMLSVLAPVLIFVLWLAAYAR